MLFLESTQINSTFSLVPWAIFLPVMGILINLLVGKRFGERGSGMVASLATGLSFIVSVVLAVALGGHPEAVSVPLVEWISIGSFDVSWAFRVDTLSVTMMLVVSGVGTLIHIYAIGYMHKDVRHNGDPGRYNRFFVFFNLFIVAMLILVTADNYLMLFVGWEGVGLCSYLLIGFWFEKGAEGLGNARAAKKAFVVNRIGDFGLLIAIFTMFWYFGTLTFDGVFEQASALAVISPGVILAITLFMLLGVTGKSAQLPLYLWLPDAMAGPTPVSALIHAATMVTAGVYLIARSAPLFVLAPTAQAVVTWVGALTAIFAAGIALTQYDIKRVLAFSTISQLGYMVAAVGMGAFVAGMFHLVTHAFFKALLFLSAGSVIQGVERGMESGGHGHSEIDPQDMRNMGGLQKRMPVTFWVFLAGALALAGIAPLAGFFSKDEILAAASQQSIMIYVLLAAAAFLTAFYMGRQIFMVFFGKSRSEAAENATESPAVITTPLIILAGLSVLGGVLNLPGVHWLETWLEHTIEYTRPGEFVVWVAALSFVLAVLGIFIAWLIYGKRSIRPETVDPLEQKAGWLFHGLRNHWWLENLYHWLITDVYGERPYGSTADFMADGFDLKVIDRINSAIAQIVRQIGRGLSFLQNGYVRSYALYILAGVVFVFYLLLR